jgi:D-cysteine desulfhydrase
VRTVGEPVAALPPVAALAIERRFPDLRGRFPRVPLTTLPTPVQPLTGLGEMLGVDLWVKRDDRSGPLYGGNKPRKLEFVLGDALARGKKAVLTTGGIGTHHGLATAIGARVVGLRTILVLIEQPVTAHVRRCLLLDQAVGAELHCARHVAGVAVSALRLCAREWRHGQLPYIVPPGGTSALSTIGYVNAAFELAEQIAAGELPEPGWIFAPLGTGGTVAGLALGAELAGLRAQIAAVLVTDILAPSRRRLARLQARTMALLGSRGNVDVLPGAEARLHVVRGYVGPGYGAPTEAARQAEALMQSEEGIELETTYTAKCLAALMDLARRPEYSGGPVLFWNTYSSVDPAAHLGPLPQPKELPPPFLRFFQGEPVAA